jgi:glycosyltransferase involved in cell wall biosynthesis
MKVALVASSYLPEPGRRVDRLARGLAQRGAEVEILTQGAAQPVLEQHEGVTIRRFPTVVGPVRFGVAPRLRERLRLTQQVFDLVDVHTRQTGLALAVASARVRRLVLTPAAPIDTFVGWPHARATRSVIAGAAQIICRSEAERDLLCATVPRAAGRTHVLPDGVDVEGLQTADPFAIAGVVLLSVDRLDRDTSVGRAIAAMPSLDPDFRLVIVGDGPSRPRLSAFAADLRISSRVQFVGAVSDATLYRWLHTAHVVVSLAGERSSGLLVTEAHAAGVSVVASDLPVHRQAAERGGGPVIFVPPRGSPLDVADAIDEAARLHVISPHQPSFTSVPTWESVIDATWELYEQLIGGSLLPERDTPAEVVDLTAQVHAGRKARAEPQPAGAQTEADRVNGESWSPTRSGIQARANGARRWS